MKTLYDLLGARPDDDAERLGTAFRKAAKASRSGLHPGHPDAPKRFRQVVEAYDILRNAEHRAAYDLLLEFDRGRLGSKLKRAISYLVHNIVSDAIGVVGLVAVLAGGHTLLAYMSKTPVNAFDNTAPGPAEVAGIQPAAGTGTTGPVEPRGILERATVPDTQMMMRSADALAANAGNALEATKSRPGSSLAGRGIEVAKTDNAVAAVAEIPNTRNINANDMKIPERKITGKPQVEAKRQAKNRTPFKQASLEDRKTSACSGQACAGEPPIFGVGF